LLIKNNEIETVWEVGGPGGGIYCKNSNSIITDSEISENISMVGGGIFCDSSNITLMNVKIMNNESTTMHLDCNDGGGIYFSNSNPTLVNVKVIGNDGGYGGGGGIYCDNSSPSFTNVTVSNNTARYGGGICFTGNSNPFFDSINRSNIYNNYSGDRGQDLYSECDSIISIVVDTFTVHNPDTTYAYPLNKFTFDILHDTLGNPNSIERINNLPKEFSLNQNYPNPFNPSTTIEFTLPKSESTTLKVYNILGKEISTLVSKKLNQGNHMYTFEGKNLASGIYYYQLVAGDYREVKKMILIR
jgi:predicted outer membrane repeat protein